MSDTETLAVDAGLEIVGNRTKVVVRYGQAEAHLFMPVGSWHGGRDFDVLVNNMAAIVSAVVSNFEAEVSDGSDTEVHG